MQAIKNPPEAGFLLEYWCPGEDSNFHGVATTDT
jgi:hypothetical protein